MAPSPETPALRNTFDGGILWVTSDNVRNRLLQSQFDYPGWQPLFGLDEYPRACQMAAAAAVMVFESGFLPASFLHRWRPLLWGGGICFHQVNKWFLNLNFSAIQRLYFGLADWRLALRWLGQRTFRRITLHFDPSNPGQARCVALSRELDLLGGLAILPGKATLASWSSRPFPTEALTSSSLGAWTPAPAGTNERPCAAAKPG